MHLFTEYIEPLTHWLIHHPHLALFITFLISFSESLAIVGSIIPGSLTMTAIGILAGTGIMRIDFTLMAAGLGAIAGDSASYTLGCLLSDRLPNLWPFNRYPNWLAYGKSYFNQYGSTSVLIGRFFGPMRSIIPLIAGMMHMNHWHFLLANFISGIAWAILYVVPGVIIGAAGSELTTEGATRLFVIILMLLFIIWLGSLGLRWLLLLFHRFFSAHLHNSWIHLKNRPLLRYSAAFLTPKNEKNHNTTAAITLLTLVSLSLSIITITCIFHVNFTNLINNPVYFFLQSIRVSRCDAFFIILTLIISPIPLFTFFSSFIAYTIYQRDWRALRYWLSLGLSTSLGVFFLIYITRNQEDNNLWLRDEALQSLSIIDFTMATALFNFFILYIRAQSKSVFLPIIRVVLLMILCLSGIGFIYLGDNGLINIMASCFIGLSLCLIHWIFYRRSTQLFQHSKQALGFVVFLFVFSSGLINFMYFDRLVIFHSPALNQYLITHDVWWNQHQQLLPVYTTNRVGKQIGLLNIQYAGSINSLVKTLKSKGWKIQSASFFQLLILKAEGSHSAEALPLRAELYRNQKPALTMTFNPGSQQQLLILKLWQSNYHLPYGNEPIWLGSLAPRIQYAPLKPSAFQAIVIHNYIIESLPKFKFKQIWLPKPTLKTIPYFNSRMLLLIKEPKKPRLSSP